MNEKQKTKQNKTKAILAVHTPKAEGYRFRIVRPAVRPSVRMSVRPSQTCWGYISKIITDLNMNLQGCEYLIEEKCTRTIKLHRLILELLPFVLYTYILCRTYFSDYKRYSMKLYM